MILVMITVMITIMLISLICLYVILIASQTSIIPAKTHKKHSIGVIGIMSDKSLTIICGFTIVLILVNIALLVTKV